MNLTWLRYEIHGARGATGVGLMDKVLMYSRVSHRTDQSQMVYNQIEEDLPDLESECQRTLQYFYNRDAREGRT